jgi:hypothetical protein
MKTSIIVKKKTSTIHINADDALPPLLWQTVQLDDMSWFLPQVRQNEIKTNMLYTNITYSIHTNSLARCQGQVNLDSDHMQSSH